MDEYFPIVVEDGTIVGKASRIECHNYTFLLHPVVHLHVFNSLNKLYLQKRSENKDIQPGKWDTSVGGHVDFGEQVLAALFREAKEELKLENFDPQFITNYKFVSEVEAELVHVFTTTYDNEIIPDKNEISEGKFWSIDEINKDLGKGVFTSNFEHEFCSIIRNLIK